MWLSLPKNILRNLNKVHKEYIEEEDRQWVKDLYSMIHKRYTSTLKKLIAKSIEVDTHYDILLRILFDKAYDRIQSYIPENNPFQVIEIGFKNENELIASNPEVMKNIVDDLFYWVDFINEVADLNNDIKDVVSKFYKYPPTLWKVADHIRFNEKYTDLSEHSLKTALYKAFEYFPQFKDVKFDGDEFRIMYDRYKHERVKSNSSKKK